MSAPFEISFADAEPFGAQDGFEPHGEVTCRGCGCSQFNPCISGEGYACAWVDDDLCSRCAALAEGTCSGCGAVPLVWATETLCGSCGSGR